MFFHHKNNIININNEVQLTLQQFKTLEPNYTDLPNGYNELYYEPNKQYYICGEGRQTITQKPDWSDGNSYFERINDFKKLKEIINNTEQQISEKVEEELEKRKPYYEKRKKEYPSLEDLVVALWENVVEKKTKKQSNILELQKIREEIKKKYPKPEDNK